jgi:hypothetical protein
VFEVPPAVLRTLANATVAPISEDRRAADVEAGAVPSDVGKGGEGDGDGEASGRLASTGA